MPVKEGRKLMFTDEEIEQIGKLAGVLNKEQIAAFFGVSSDTLNERMKDQEGVREQIESGRSKAQALVAKGLLQKALDGNLTAQIFYLKTQAGWREKESIEISGKDGGPIETKDLTDDPVGILHRRVVSIASRLGAVEVIEGDDGDRRELPSAQLEVLRSPETASS